MDREAPHCWLVCERGGAGWVRDYLCWSPRRRARTWTVAGVHNLKMLMSPTSVSTGSDCGVAGGSRTRAGRACASSAGAVTRTLTITMMAQRGRQRAGCSQPGGRRDFPFFPTPAQPGPARLSPREGPVCISKGLPACRLAASCAGLPAARPRGRYRGVYVCATRADMLSRLAYRDVSPTLLNGRNSFFGACQTSVWPSGVFEPAVSRRGVVEWVLVRRPELTEPWRWRPSVAIFQPRPGSGVDAGQRAAGPGRVGVGQ